MKNNDPILKQGSEQKGGKFISAFCSVLGIIGIIIVIALYVPVTVPSLMGINVYNIVSGSMAPSIPVGSIVYVKQVDCASIEEGTVIAYDNGGMTITHRVMENHVEDSELITKGDANEGEDITPVRYASVIGEVTFHAPYLGAVFEFCTSKSGKKFLLFGLAAFFLLYMLGARSKDNAKKKYAVGASGIAGATEATNVTSETSEEIDVIEVEATEVIDAEDADAEDTEAEDADAEDTDKE